MSHISYLYRYWITTINTTHISKCPQFSPKIPHSTRVVVESLVRPNSRWSITETIESLGRGFWACADLQAFSCYRCWTEECNAKRDFSNIETRGVMNFYFLQKKAPKEIHSILTEIWRKTSPNVYHRKKCAAIFIRGDFITCVSPRLGRN